MPKHYLRKHLMIHQHRHPKKYCLMFKYPFALSTNCTVIFNQVTEWPDFHNERFTVWADEMIEEIPFFVERIGVDKIDFSADLEDKCKYFGWLAEKGLEAFGYLSIVGKHGRRCVLAAHFLKKNWSPNYTT